MSTPLKVATYNVHSCVGSDWKYSPARVASTLAALGSDLIALQEIEANDEFQQTRLWSEAHHDDQPELLRSLSGMKHVRFAKCINCIATGTLSNGKEKHNKPECKGRFGVAILSNLDILDERTLVFKKCTNRRQQVGERSEREERARGAGERSGREVQASAPTTDANERAEGAGERANNRRQRAGGRSGRARQQPTPTSGRKERASERTNNRRQRSGGRSERARQQPTPTSRAS
jgi:hypothetical protein